MGFSSANSIDDLICIKLIQLQPSIKQTIKLHYIFARHPYIVNALNPFKLK